MQVRTADKILSKLLIHLVTIVFVQDNPFVTASHKVRIEIRKAILQFIEHLRNPVRKDFYFVLSTENTAFRRFNCHSLVKFKFVSIGLVFFVIFDKDRNESRNLIYEWNENYRTDNLEYSVEHCNTVNDIVSRRNKFDKSHERTEENKNDDDSCNVKKNMNGSRAFSICVCTDCCQNRIDS